MELVFTEAALISMLNFHRQLLCHVQRSLKHWIMTLKSNAVWKVIQRRPFSGARGMFSLKTMEIISKYCIFHTKNPAIKLIINYLILSIRHTAANNDLTSSVLHIQSIEKDQYGDYFCVATNKLGSAERRLNVFGR